MAGKRKGFGFSIGLDLSGFSQSCKELNKQIDQLLGADLVKMSNMAAGALTGVATAISAVGAAAYKFGSEMDKLKTSLEGTWGSAQKATEQYRKFQNIVENTSINMSQLVAVDKTMKSLGLSVEDSEKAIKRLVNTAVGNPQTSIEALSSAMQQINLTGTASARSLKVFADAGIEVADLAGKDAATALQILMDRMQQFNGYMEKESTDIWQQIPRIIAIVNDMLADLGNYLNDNFKIYFVAAGNVVSNFRDRFRELLSDKDGIAKVTEEIKRLMTVMAPFASVTAVKFAISLAPIAAQIVAVVAGVEVLYDLLGKVSIWDKFVNGCKYAVAKVKEYFFTYIKKPLLEIFEWLAIKIGSTTDVEDAHRFLKEINEDIVNAGIDAQKANEAIGDGIFGTGTDTLTMKAVTGIEKLVSSYNSELAKLKTPDGGTNSTISGTQTVNHVFSFNDGIKKDNRVPVPSTKSTKTSNSNNPKNYNLGYGPNGMMEYALGVGYDQMKSASSAPWVQELMEWKKNLLEYEKSIDELKEKWIDAKISLVESFSSGLNEALWASGNFFQNIGKFFKDFGKQIIQQVTQLMLMTSLLRMFGYHYDVQGLSLGNIMSMSDYQKTINPPSIGDGIVQNGKIIGTDPEDTIIAMKHPENLNGGANVVVNVNNNTQSHVTTNSYFDGERTIIDLVISAVQRNVSGSKDFLRAL